MGRRYGRNQKRKHRETIADLSEQIDAGISLVKEQDKSISHWRGLYRDLVDNIEEYCKNHAVLEPKVVMKNKWFYEGRRQIEWEKYEHIPMSDVAMHAPVTMEVHSVMLHVIDVLVRYEEFDDSVHIILKRPKEEDQCIYAVSGKELDNVWANPGFIKYLVDRIKHNLLMGMARRRDVKLR